MPPPSFSHQTAVVLPRAIQSWLKDLIHKIRSALLATDESTRHSILSAIESAVEEHAHSLQSASNADEANHPAAAGPSPSSQIRSHVSLRINDAIQNLFQNELESQQHHKLPALIDTLFVTMPLLGPTFIVMDWWDLVLCPLLKNASVQNITANRARELVVRAMVAAPSTAYEDEPCPTPVWPNTSSTEAEAASPASAASAAGPRRARAAPYPISAAAPLAASSSSPSRPPQRSSSVSIGSLPASRSASVSSRQDTFRRFTQRIFDLYLAEAAHQSHPVAADEAAHSDQKRFSATDAHKPATPAHDHVAVSDQSRAHLVRDPSSIVWKGNLESILLVYSNEKPKEFFHHVAESFHDPAARVALLFLLSTFLRLYPIHAYHITSTALPRMLFLSLQLDTSTTCVSLGVTALIMLIPHIPNWIANGGAGGLPTLLSIFARIVDWRRLGHGWESRVGNDPQLEQMRREKDEEFTEIDRLGKRLDMKRSLRWNRLESSFDTTMSTPPNAEHLFTFLYGLFPCNVIRFLRSPIDYLRKASFDSPFEGPWEDMMDEVAVQTRSDPILRRHTIHPAIITMDAETELTDKQRWLDHDSADINAECLGLFLGKWHDVNSSHIVQAERQRSGSLGHDVPDDETASVFSSEARLGAFDMDRRRSAVALMHPSWYGASGSVHRQWQRLPRSVNPDEILLTYASLRSGAPLVSTGAAGAAGEAASEATCTLMDFGSAIQPMAAAAQRLDEATPMPTRAASGMAASSTLSKLLPAASAAAAATPAIVTAMGSSSASHVACSMPVSPATHVSLARVRSRSGSMSSLQSLNHTVSGTSPLSPTSRHALAMSHLAADAPTTAAREASSDTALSAMPSYDTTMRTAVEGSVGSQATSVSLLQRENLLLRNELNFELYLKEQHLRHIGRLHREKVTDTALEAERQNLYHTVRTLRTSNEAQHAELERCRAEASATKARHVQWEADLNNKLKAYREERKAWTSEARQLKAQAEEDSARIVSLTRQLEQTGAQLFEMHTQLQSDRAKMVKLEQYEAKIAQLTECLAYWDADVLKYEQQRVQMRKLLDKWDQMVYLVEATEASLDDVQNRLQSVELENQHLSAELTRQVQQRTALSHEISVLLSEQHPKSMHTEQELHTLTQECARLGETNQVLQAQLLEFKATIEAIQDRDKTTSTHEQHDAE